VPLRARQTATLRRAPSAGFACAGREIERVSPMGLRSRACLDNYGRIVVVETPGLLPVVLAYDGPLGALTRVTQGSREVRYAYDVAGRPTPYVQRATAQLATGDLEAALTRDPAGWVSGSSLRAGAGPIAWSIVLERDARGDVVGMTLPHREEHGLAWTALGALRRYAPPWPGAETVGLEAPGTLATREADYDPLHRPERSTLYGIDASGAQTQEDVGFDYDPLHGTLTSVRLPDGRSISAGWDVAALDASREPVAPATGRLEWLSGPDAVDLALSYDGPFLETQTWSETEIPDVTDVGSVSRTIDAYGEVSAVWTCLGSQQCPPPGGLPLPSAHLVGYGRNEDGQLTRAGAMIVDPRAVPSVASIDHWERVTTLGEATTREVFDRHGALSQITATASDGTVLFTWRAVARDELGRLTEETDSRDTRRYAYEVSGNLRSVTDASGNPLADYTYDANGNRLSASYAPRGPGARDFAGMRRLGAEPGAVTYDRQDRLTRYSDCTFEHDAAGNRTVQVCDGMTGSLVGDVTLEHDRLGNLRSVSDVDRSGPGTPGLVRVAYQVDALGRRVRRQVWRDGIEQASEERRWLWLDALRPSAELDDSGALRWLFVWGTRPNLPDYAVRFTGGSASAVYRLVGDGRGSLRVVIDAASGALVETHDYDPFGVELPPRRPGPDFGRLELPFRFAGGMWDPLTHLVRFGARDYDPVTGRWVQRDPILFAGRDTNLYQYCGADPVNRIDPRGTDDEMGLTHIDDLPYLWWSVVWSGIPNVLGTVVGVAGSGSDAATGRNNTLEFYDNSIANMAVPGGAITFGHVICYGADSPSDDLRKHELAHVEQADVLGPVYLQAHLAAQVWSQAISTVAGPRSGGPGAHSSYSAYNPLEWGPYSSPPTPWAWW